MPIGEVIRIAVNLVVNSISFDRNSSGFRDQLLHFVDRQTLWGGCSRIVVNQFVPDGSVDIIRTVGERGLSGFDS